MLCDTTFLIHYAGQRGKAAQVAAREFAESHQDLPLYASRVSWADFAEGCETRADVERLLANFTILEIDEDIAWLAAPIARSLDRRGLPVGDNDVWIAATTLAYGTAIVTRNVGHFKRIPGLKVAEY